MRDIFSFAIVFAGAAYFNLLTTNIVLYCLVLLLHFHQLSSLVYGLVNCGSVYYKT